jgi:2-iminobutanoate/2-iminopropanoate deaminase
MALAQPHHWTAAAPWLVAAALLGACERTGPPTPFVEYIPMEGGARLPFSAAVRVGRLLILSGQLGNDSTGRLVAGGIAAETRQALDNIRRVLERNGSSLDQVVKCTAMLADIQDWGAMNQVYVTYFPRQLPARSAFGASGLALGARIELECWATASDGPAR